MFPWQLLLWKRVKNIFTVIIGMVLNRKNSSLGDSMLKHPGYATLTSWIFLKLLPVVGIIEIWKSWKYWPLTSSGSDFMAFQKVTNWWYRIAPAKGYIFLDNFLLKNNSGLKNSPGYLFWLTKLTNDIEIALKPTGY